MPEFSISDVDKALLSASNIDAELTARLVHTFGAQQAAHTAAERKKGVRVRALKIPEIDNRRIIDARAEIPLNISERRAAAQLAKYIPYSRMREYIMPMLRRAATADGAINWSNELLAHLGREL